MLHFSFSAPIRAVYDFIHSPFFYCLFLTSSRFYITTTQCITFKMHLKIKCLHTIPAMYISEKIEVENYIFSFLWWLFGVGKNAWSTLKHILAFVISDWVELEISIFKYEAYSLFHISNETETPWTLRGCCTKVNFHLSYILIIPAGK